MNNKDRKIFETIFNSNRVEYVPYTKDVNVTVQENRATIDEGIRLIQEMHDKVINNILGTLKIEENFCNITGFFYQANPIIYSKILHFRYKLNGKEYQDSIEVEHSMLLDISSHRDKLIKQLIDKFSESITKELMKQLIPQMVELKMF